MIPNLTELVLRLPWDVDMAYISTRLKPLRTLRKSTLQTFSYHTRLSPYSRSQLSFFSSVIARNPNLTHLALMLDRYTPCNFSDMLRDIPDNKPLRLESVTIDCLFENADALLPHIQSLSSLETRLNDANNTTLYSMLGRELVFPPAISVDFLENDLCIYLESHPGVSNLSIDCKGHLGSSREDYGLSKIIMRHSGTLRKLRTRSDMLLTLDAELALLKCMQLSELVLIFPDGAILINEKHVLDIAAHLSQSLTVVVEHRTSFLACVNYCRNSENPLIHDLAGRIVYEKPDEIPPVSNR